MARTIEINGYNVSISPDWSIQEKINTMSSFKFTITDKGSLTSVEIGHTIEYFVDGVPVFVGLITRISKTEKIPGIIFYDCDGVDNSWLATRRIIAQSIDNKTAKEIIIDYILPILVEEGVTAGQIADGVTIKKGVFNYIKCSQALDYIRDLNAVYSWNIDKDRKLNFYNKGDYLATTDIDSNLQHFNFNQSTDNTDYRNKQYLRGGKGLTSLQTNELSSPKPDGNSRSFVFRFPIGLQPVKLEVYNGSWTEVNQNDIGVNGLDTGASKKWYWSYGSNILSQNYSETVLGVGQLVRMTYYGLRDIFIIMEDLEEIEARKLNEWNSSGVYDSVVVEKSIESLQQATQFSTGLLDKYGELKDTITLTTNSNVFKAGQLVTVNKPLFGITDSKFLIETINIVPAGPDLISYRLQIVDGATVGGWESYFKTMYLDIKQYEINANETLIYVKFFNENRIHDIDLQVRVFVPLSPEAWTYPAEWLYPTSLNLPTVYNLTE